ncbi:MAG: diphthine--ammonia ligase [Candidatus Omnitrophota bacterium]
MKVACLWSGGKDSCFACYKAVNSGYNIVALFNFTDTEGKNSLSHGLPAELIARQAELTGIPLVQRSMPKETYAEKFKELVSEWKEKEGIQGVVFGDIYLKEHKEWIDKICKELKIEAILPLWERDSKELAMEIINSGFKSIVVSTKAGLLGEEWLGRNIDKEFLKELAPGIDPCGEKGEFHTLVVDGPIFSKPIKIIETESAVREMFGKHWFLDIKKYA